MTISDYIEHFKYYGTGSQRVCMDFAHCVASMSNCLSRQVGCVFVSKDNEVLCFGANGTLSSQPPCDEVGCARKTADSGTALDKCQAVHAEQNAIASCARLGTSTEGSTVYLTVSPCDVCARLLVQAGVARAVYDEVYPNSAGISILESAGVECEKFSA